ncbi:MAG TPA: hypothetical protein VGT79_11155, partial [Xanthomonadaceae bacterium]|nr:hypothetical protein [Xanthomonadaceae bacterium]
MNRAISLVISAGSGRTSHASDGISGVVFRSGGVSQEKRAHAAWNPGVSDGIPGRSTEHSCGSTWIPEIAACFSIFADGISSKSDGNRGVLMNTPALLMGFFRETYNTRKNPIGSPRN